DRHAIQLVETLCQHVGFADGRPIARHLPARRSYDELAPARGRHATQEPGVAGREQHADGLQAAVGTHAVEVGAVGDVEVTVVADREIQRPVQPTRQYRADFAAGKNLGDLAGDVRYQQSAVDKGAVVQPGGELRENGLVASARIDAKHLT